MGRPAMTRQGRVISRRTVTRMPPDGNRYLYGCERNVIINGTQASCLRLCLLVFFCHQLPSMFHQSHFGTQASCLRCTALHSPPCDGDPKNLFAWVFFVGWWAVYMPPFSVIIFPAVFVLGGKSKNILRITEISRCSAYKIRLNPFHPACG